MSYDSTQARPGPTQVPNRKTRDRGRPVADPLAKDSPTGNAASTNYPGVANRKDRGSSGREPAPLVDRGYKQAAGGAPNVKVDDANVAADGRRTIRTIEG